jgi:hypothetical protein
MDTKKEFAAWRATALLRLLLGVLAFVALLAAEDSRTEVEQERGTPPDQLKPGW